MLWYHHVGRAKRWLYTNDLQATVLWGRLRALFPEAGAACLMPNHFHLILPHDDGRLPRACARWTLWQRTHGIRDFEWVSLPAAERIATDGQHLRRTIRYTHLNPCRAGLVNDPLAWAWSTHRDHTGFAAPAWGSLQRDPAAFHAWVSSDPSCTSLGSELPVLPRTSPSLREITDAVGGVTRLWEPLTTPLGRRLVAQVAFLHGFGPTAIGNWVGVLPRQAARLRPAAPSRWSVKDRALAGCSAACLDPRFDLPGPGELPRTPAWQRFWAKRGRD